MIDAAELARLRAKDWPLTGDETMSLLDALEQAWEEREAKQDLEVTQAICFDRVVRQRDAARALLKKIHDNAYPGKAFAARIAAALKDTP